MFEYEHLLDVNRLYTNNIHQVAEMYGIEAAQRSIIRELRAVQSAYDIKVCDTWVFACMYVTK